MSKVKITGMKLGITLTVMIALLVMAITTNDVMNSKLFASLAIMAGGIAFSKHANKRKLEG